MNKYIFLLLNLLILLITKPAQAGCYFDTKGKTTVTATVGSQKPFEVLNNTEQSLIRSIMASISETIYSRCDDDSSHTGTTQIIIGGMGPYYQEEDPEGGTLFAATNDKNAGLAYSLKIIGQNSGLGGPVKNSGTIISGSKEQLDGERWSVHVRLWHLGGYYYNQHKITQTINQTSIGALMAFKGTTSNDDSVIINVVIPPANMQTATCNLSVSSNVVDFGKLSINRPDTWPRQKLTLTSDSCSQVGMAEMRVLSNGSPKSSDNTLLLNKLTGDSAATGVGLAFYRADDLNNQYKIDADLADVSNCDSSTNNLDGFFMTCVHNVSAKLQKIDSEALKNGDFETTATFSVSYY